MAMHQIEALRLKVDGAIRHGSRLIADLRAISERFPVVLPSLAELTETERQATVLRLCGLDEHTPARLAALVENLADVLAGLTSTDGGEAWLQHRLAMLRAGDGEEDEATAA